MRRALIGRFSEFPVRQAWQFTVSFLQDSVAGPILLLHMTALERSDALAVRRQLDLRQQLERVSGRKTMHA